MDHLPVELISEIIRDLQQCNVSGRPSDPLTGTTKEEFEDWLVHTVSSRHDICNFRLVSRKFYNSSFHTFADLLGNRVFQITQSSFEDLFAISRTRSLRPHVRKLTFGTPRYADDIVMAGILQALDEPYKAKLHVSYTDHCRWHMEHRSSQNTEVLAHILGRMPNLRTLRILLLDNGDLSNYLRRWLSLDDAAIVARSFSESSSPLFDSENIHKLGPIGLLTPLDPVFCALKSTKAVIQDLRFGPSHAPPPSDLSRMLNRTNIISNLRRLRMPMDPTHLRESESFYYCCLADSFQGLSNVTHLTLSLVQVAGFERFADATSNLLNLLRPLDRMQHLTIRGSWWFSEEQLIDFVSSRGGELILLSLKDPVMHAGSWSSTVSRLAQLQSSNLRYLEVCAMGENNLNDGDLSDPVNDVDWDKFLVVVKKPIEQWASCSVSMSCGDNKYVFERSEHADM